MADKVYCEVEGMVWMPVRMRIEVALRTEPGSNSGRTIRAWARNMGRTAFRDADLEVLKVTCVDDLEDPSAHVDEMLSYGKAYRMDNPVIKILDAK